MLERAAIAGTEEIVAALREMLQLPLDDRDREAAAGVRPRTISP